jgi:hypothetical protein
MTRGYRSWFQDLINVSTMPATTLKNKVMYRQFIRSVRLCKLKMYMFKTFTFRKRLVYPCHELMSVHFALKWEWRENSCQQPNSGKLGHIYSA